MTSQIAVLGGGMVGACCALELQARGHKVTLIERAQAGAETSGGNAGVVARSSLVPLNQPALWAQLPKLLGNRSAALRYDAGFLLRHPAWVLGFLGSARQRVFDETVPALDALIRLSTERLATGRSRPAQTACGATTVGCMPIATREPANRRRPPARCGRASRWITRC
jgi:D-amino-acid dehydrogenase